MVWVGKKMYSDMKKQLKPIPIYQILVYHPGQVNYHSNVRPTVLKSIYQDVWSNQIKTRSWTVKQRQLYQHEWRQQKDERRCDKCQEQTTDGWQTDRQTDEGKKSWCNNLTLVDWKTEPVVDVVDEVGWVTDCQSDFWLRSWRSNDSLSLSTLLTSPFRVCY